MKIDIELDELKAILDHLSASEERKAKSNGELASMVTMTLGPLLRDRLRVAPEPAFSPEAKTGTDE